MLSGRAALSDIVAVLPGCSAPVGRTPWPTATPHSPQSGPPLRHHNVEVGAARRLLKAVRAGTGPRGGPSSFLLLFLSCHLPTERLRLTYNGRGADTMVISTRPVSGPESISCSPSGYQLRLRRGLDIGNLNWRDRAFARTRGRAPQPRMCRSPTRERSLLPHRADHRQAFMGYASVLRGTGG